MFKNLARRLFTFQDRKFLSWHRRRFGLMRSVAPALGLLRRKDIVRMPLPEPGASVFLRPGTADQGVFDQVFISREYEMDLGKPKFILDAGAHIWLASVYFALKYPGAVIVALEPEPSNFVMLLRNTRPFSNIKPLCAGLWSRKATLKLQNPGAPTSGYRVTEASAGEGIPALGVRDILADFKPPRINLLKVDIEGSEAEVFGADTSWLGDVDTVVIELHDRFRSGCSEAFSNALFPYEYERRDSGEFAVATHIRKTKA
ncbi:FkbM family methyltransferase [Candidatus Sumerlaeota bacterium]|nr:FkbM family methyltransferase [Candidatus Sumerlaeota bacterium]